jgi:DNA-binding response OmpR family regulator
MRRTVTRYLSTRNEVEVVGEASNFEEAARLVGEFTPDVVVIDVRMSRLVDSTTRNIKEICDCRMIAISASVDGETASLAETFGSDAFIDKMYLYDRLMPKILELSGRTSRADGPDEPLRILQEGEFGYSGERNHHQVQDGRERLAGSTSQVLCCRVVPAFAANHTERDRASCLVNWNPTMYRLPLISPALHKLTIYLS